MAIKEQARAEIDEKFKWDLSVMYCCDEKWYEEYKKVKEKVSEFSKYQGHILDSSQSLYNTLKDYVNLERVLSKLYVYACMKSDEDTSNTHYQKMKGEVQNLSVLVSSTTSFVVPELIQSDYSLIEQYIAELPELACYKRMLKDIYRFKKYTLSKKEEKIISKLSKVLDSSSLTANLVRNSDLTFGTITDEEGREVELTNSNFTKYMESSNRDVRKQAFYTLYQGYEKVKNTLASTLASQVETNVAIADIRGYKSALEMSLFGSNVDVNIYHNLIKVVNDNLYVLHKYYNLKKEYLKLDELNLYDVYAPLVEEENNVYKFEKAKEIVINALSVLGEKYINDLKRAFDEKWIDIYPNKGKRSGAYSWGCYDSYPYILLNYHERFNDVSTLAHELGHSMHSFYSRKHNEYQDAHYEIFVAEVASIVNELLLYRYMIDNSNDKKQKLNILNNILELFRGTLFRQTMFAEFELEIYNLVNNNEVLTHDTLSKIYYDLNKKYFGDNVVVNEEIKYEWARIPHFYTSFYVYQYATGMAAACAIVNDIINKGEDAINKYLEFLKTGGRDYPVELLKIAGVDLSKPEPIKEAIKLFEKTIDEFIKLSQK